MTPARLHEDGDSGFSTRLFFVDNEDDVVCITISSVRQSFASREVNFGDLFMQAEAVQTADGHQNLLLRLLAKKRGGRGGRGKMGNTVDEMGVYRATIPVCV